jgi:Asp-tRNA(Asn)/Glu-tRNA(Gln) amidotransferase A subunit family amidase
MDELSKDLSWMPAWQLRRLLITREVSAFEVTRHFLARIEQLDPTICAFFTVTAEMALDQARGLDRAFSSGEPIGPLHGIPVSVKDHLEVQGVRCSYGESQYRGFVPYYDQIAVERMRKAGAIFIGKTNMPGRDRPGITDRPCANPWDTNRVPGASSAGAAAAVAAGFGPIALCSDGAGSIRVPGAFCGLVGLHPTARRTPGYNYKIEAFASHWSATVGPLCRDPRDAAPRAIRPGAAKRRSGDSHNGGKSKPAERSHLSASPRPASIAMAKPDSAKRDITVDTYMFMSQTKIARSV